MDGMICGALLCVFLCGLQEAAASPRGRCAGALCSYELFLDFDSAKQTCQDSNGELFVSKEIQTLTSLLKGLRGRFWLDKTDRRNLRDCRAVSVEGGQNVSEVSVPCKDKLDGHVCRFESGDICSPLQVSEGRKVTYTTNQGYELLSSDMLPPGTFATVGYPKYPDSKHLCATMWIKAPWTCEVLNGGCEHSCSSTHRCICPIGHKLHHNNISCIMDSCAACAQGCQKNGDSHACTCTEGYRLTQDGKSCEDVNECEEKLDSCTSLGETCVNEKGGYKCECAEDYVEEDGACINNAICFLCEHKCEKIEGVYQCVCRKDFRVSPKDPTKCEPHCESECAARCVRNPELEQKDMQQCFCAEGYILERKNQTAVCYDIDECEQQNLCDHRCENTYGGYRCACDEGFKQVDYECVMEEEGEERGSGSASELVPPTDVQTAALPPYVKAGSVLGIAVFFVSVAVLLIFLTRKMLRRCRRFNFTTFKHGDIDIFYLQQVTTETYKRFSFDKQFKNDSQRL